jgi:hypothetical protein
MVPGPASAWCTSLRTAPTIPIRIWAKPLGLANGLGWLVARRSPEIPSTLHSLPIETEARADAQRNSTLEFVDKTLSFMVVPTAVGYYDATQAVVEYAGAVAKRAGA